MILSHAEILSRHIAFANQFFLLRQICDGDGRNAPRVFE